MLWKHRKQLAIFLLLLLVVSTTNSVHVERAHAKEPVSNVIFMIPDGFSASYATNYRIFKGEDLVFDPLLVGMMKTHSNNSWVTDSAAAASAMATGHKVNNRMISVDPAGKPYKTILEVAKESGKSTGLVATVSITDATPAAFASHVKSRKDETAIAEQMIGKVDVLLGGGKRYFTPKEKGGKRKQNDLLTKARNEGYWLLNRREEMLEVSEEVPKLLGLFADNDLEPVLNRPDDQPSLEEMTNVALNILHRNENGFFLMVEGSQIDRAGHINDPVWAMSEAQDFEKAVAKVLKYASENDDTLVIIAADHDTGGVSVGGYNEYVSKVEKIREIEGTAKYIARQFNKDRSNIKDVFEDVANIKLSRAEVKEIKRTKDKRLTTVISHIISEKAYVGWLTNVHTGVDVPVYAFGPYSEMFQGHQDNTDIPKKIAQAMGLTLE